MLEKINMLDSEQYRRKLTLFYPYSKPRIYREGFYSRNCERGAYFMEERVLRRGYGRSRRDVSEKGRGRVTALPLVYW